MQSLLSLLDRILIKAGLERPALRVRALEFWRNGEPEVRLLPLLVDPCRTAVDIGAANGVYSWHLMRLAAKVVAFEPNPQSYKALHKAMPELKLHQLALSDKTGSATLRVPVSRNVAASGWGTIHDTNVFQEIVADDVKAFDVQVARLDDFGLHNVGFIKIDVEGHELDVLRGTIDLLKRERPSLLIEVGGGSRGNDPSAVCTTLRNLGYATMYLRDGARLGRVESVPASLDAINIIAIPDSPAF